MKISIILAIIVRATNRCLLSVCLMSNMSYECTYYLDASKLLDRKHTNIIKEPIKSVCDVICDSIPSFSYSSYLLSHISKGTSLLNKYA